MTDTKPPACIFCGGRTRFISDHSGHNHFLVRCVDDNHCSGEGPIRPTRAEAVSAFLKPVDDARRKALEEAAKTAEWSHMVPPDGGSPTEDECKVASEAGRQIRALIDTPGDAA